MDYKIGDRITYTTFLGNLRTVTVTARESNIKNGRPGFDGTTVADGMTVWGYDDQIVAWKRVDTTEERV